MESEILAALARSNLAAAAAILAVAIVRPVLRRLAGARLTYAAWLAVPLAAAASLLPARSVVTVAARTAAAPATLPGGPISLTRAAPPIVPAALHLDWSAIALWSWLIGAAMGLAWLAWRQHRFLAEIGPVRRDGQILHARHSTAGPAVIGVFAPRILAPADFDRRFSPREQEVVLAHERNHIAQGDPWINALVLIWQCVNWFNPLAHMAARALRLDQEFACDAAVMARFPKARRSYAEAMLKAQTAAMALPLGCYWPAAATSALEQRLVLLGAPPPSPRRHALGLSATTLLALLTSLAVWSAQPARRIVLQMPAALASPPPTAFLSHAEQAAPAPVTPASVLGKTALADDAAERPQIALDASPAPSPDAAPAPLDSSPDAVVRRATSFIDNWTKTWRPPQPPELSRAPDGLSAEFGMPRLRPGAVLEFTTGAELPGGGVVGEALTYRAGESSLTGSRRGDGHHDLRPNIRQIDDDKLEFRPALYLDGQLVGSGSAIVSGSGRMTTILLDNGQAVSVSALLHPSADRPPRPG